MHTHHPNSAMNSTRAETSTSFSDQISSAKSSKISDSISRLPFHKLGSTRSSADLIHNLILKIFATFATKMPSIDFLEAKRLFFQPACFGAGCYIEMALTYHQPHQHELVGG